MSAQAHAQTQSAELKEFKSKEINDLDEVQNLKDDIGHIREDLRSLTSKLAAIGIDRFERSKDSLVEGSKDLVDKTKDKTLELTKTAEQQIGEKPFLSVAAAFGAGVVLSRLLSALRK